MKQKLGEMTFFQHLGELRKRILLALSGVLVGFIIGWAFVDKIYYWLSIPVLQFLPPGEKLAFTSLTEPFMMYMKLAFIAGIFIAAPFVFYQLWAFISPGLYAKEKKMVVPFVSMTTIFFFLGGAFGYFMVFPWACKFFLSIGKNFKAIIKISDYFSLAIQVLLGIAVVFELPVLIYLLAKFRIVTAKFLLKYFRYAIVIIFIVSAIITPTPDAVTQSLFAIPMILLYLLSILIAKIVAPKPNTDA